MPKVVSRINRSAKKYPLKRGTFISDNPQNQVRINQAPKQNTRPPQENAAFALSPLASYAYTTVTLGILFFGIFTSSFQLLQLAFFMAIALLGPSILEIIISKVFKK